MTIRISRPGAPGARAISDRARGAQPVGTRARQRAGRARRADDGRGPGPPRRARPRPPRTRRPRPRSPAGTQVRRREAIARRASRILVSSTSMPSATARSRSASAPDEVVEDRGAPSALAVLERQRVVGRPGARHHLLRGVELLDRASPQRPFPLELRRTCGSGSGALRADTSRASARGPCRPTEWLPSTTSASGCARWTTLRNGRHGLRGSLIGACEASRSVMRSSNERPSSGTGTKWRTNDWTSPYRRGIEPSTSGSEPPRGHQNSSTSPLITQSAPCSLAARRAMRVTHSRCRNGPSGSRITPHPTVALVSARARPRCRRSTRDR